MADDLESDASAHRIAPLSTPDPDEVNKQIRDSERELRELNRTASQFARTIAGAFAQGIASGKSFDDTLKGLYLRLSNMALQTAIRPVGTMLTSVIGQIAGGGAGSLPGSPGGRTSGGGRECIVAGTANVQPFAAGGVIGTPTYFPLSSGGLGLAGEAGPEAILPLTRNARGQLGVAAAGGAPSASIVVNIATPDADSFRRSEVYVTGQIARAVARGQRGL